MKQLYMCVCRCLTFEHYYRDACSLLDHWERQTSTVRPLTPPSKQDSEIIDSVVSRGLFTFYLVTFTQQSHLGLLLLPLLEVKGPVWNGTPSHSYRVSLAVWDHTVLPSTWHKRTYPALTLARQAGTWFIYFGGAEGWVNLCDQVHTEMVYLPTDGHPSKY